MIRIAGVYTAWMSILTAGCLFSGCATKPPASSPRGSGSRDACDILDGMSPKVKTLLDHYPSAAVLLSNTCSSVVAGKTARLYYFYDPYTNRPSAFHSYAGANGVTIAVRENQSAWDQYLGLLFEIINSSNQPKFTRLALQAERGKLSRRDFPVQVLELEHQAVLRTRELVVGLGLASSEFVDSVLYKRLLNSPNRFDEFLAYVQQPENKRNPLLEYQQQYDQNKNAH